MSVHRHRWEGGHGECTRENKRTERFSEKSLNLENSLNSERSGRVQRQGSITFTPATAATDIDTTTPALAKLGKMVIERLQNSRCLGSRLTGSRLLL
jgi:hypothetical protein